MTYSDNRDEDHDEDQDGSQNVVQPLRLPPLSNTKLRYRDSRSHDPKKVGIEWYWKLSQSLPELWIRNADEIDEAMVKKLETAWRKYQKLGVPGAGDGAGRGARKWQNRAALKEKYEKLESKKKYPMEVALARYDHFVIDGATGKLDYHEKESDGKKGTKTSKRNDDAACLVM